jgi:hypothetical protein
MDQNKQRLSRVVDGDHEIGDISVQSAGAITSESIWETLKINKLPSGSSGGVGHKYINVPGPLNTNNVPVVPAQRLISTTAFNKLP